MKLTDLMAGEVERVPEIGARLEETIFQFLKSEEPPLTFGACTSVIIYAFTRFLVKRNSNKMGAIVSARMIAEVVRSVMLANLEDHQEELTS